MRDFVLPDADFGTPASKSKEMVTLTVDGFEVTVPAGTSIMREYPCADGEPFYPVPRPENEARYQRYKALAAEEARVSFVGRLAEYRYYNMDQVVGAALKTAADLGA